MMWNLRRAFYQRVLKGQRGLLGQSCSRSTFIPEEKVFQSPFENMQLPEMSFSEYVFQDVNQWRNKTAMECVTTGESITFDELESNVKAFASGFARMGFKPGDVVIVALTNSILFPIITLALTHIGVTAAPLNPLYTPYELANFFRLTKAKAVVSQPIFMPNIKDALEEVSDMDIKVFADGIQPGPLDARIMPLKTILESSRAEDKTDFLPAKNVDVRKDVAVLPFSSGTTGAPKGVMLSHTNLIYGLESFEKMTNLRKRSSNGNLCIYPSFHILGFLFNLIHSLRFGVSFYFMPVFDWNTYLSSLISKRPSSTGLVPPLLSRMALDPAVTKEHFASIEALGIGGAPMNKGNRDLFLTKLRADTQFSFGYGLTECPLVTMEIFRDPTNVGKLAPNVRAKVIDPTSGKPRGPGENGELCVQGDLLTLGYFNNATATSQSLIDGWFHTGDIVQFDEQGRIRIEDRKKDLIKRKGLQVSPSEVEEVIRQVPGVAEACVVGVPDQQDGEVPKAFVQVCEGSSVSPDEIHTHVNQKLSPHKQLKGGIQFVQELPISPSGKILRKQLRV